MERARGRGKPAIDLDIAVLGSVNRVERVDETMGKLYELKEDRFEQAAPPDTPQTATSIALNRVTGPFPPSRRMSAQKRAELLKAWKDKQPENMERGLAHLLGVALPGTGIRVISRNRSIKKPHLTVTFHHCEAFEYHDTDDAEWDTLVESIKPPQRGPYGIEPVNYAYRLPPSASYPVEWANRGSNVEVILTPETFRPNTPWESAQDDYVIVTRNPDAETVKATWSLTEEDSDHITTGTLEVSAGTISDARMLMKTTFLDPLK